MKNDNSMRNTNSSHLQPHRIGCIGRRTFGRGILCAMILVVFSQLAQAEEWSQWKKLKGWQGFDFRIRRAEYNEPARKYNWYLQFRSRYQSKVHFSFHFGLDGESTHALTDRMDLNSGKTDEYWGLYAASENHQMTVWFGKVRFGEKDD